MVDIDSVRLDSIFHALGDPTRRGMLASLALGGKSVGELAEPFPMSLVAASKHTRVLEEAGLVRREVRGRTHVCSLEAEPLADAERWLRQWERFWSIRLDHLQELVEGHKKKKGKRKKKS
jgi:DNA-binding transcriptional ArsR family regulator